MSAGDVLNGRDDADALFAAAHEHGCSAISALSESPERDRRESGPNIAPPPPPPSVLETSDASEDEESEDGSNRGEQLPHGASAAITWPAEQSSAVAVTMIPGGDGDSDDNDSDDSDDSSSDDEGGTKLSFRTSTKPNADDDDDDGDKDDREEFELVD